MGKITIKWAYQTMTAGVVEGFRMPGVEYAFADGQYCMEKYAQMRDAYDRLCERLGVRDEDRDVEEIIQSLMDI